MQSARLTAPAGDQAQQKPTQHPEVSGGGRKGGASQLTEMALGVQDFLRYETYLYCVSHVIPDRRLPALLQ